MRASILVLPFLDKGVAEGVISLGVDEGFSGVLAIFVLSCGRKEKLIVFGRLKKMNRV